MDNKLPDKIYYSPKEVAEILQCSERHVRNLVNRGELPGRRFGTLLRIPCRAIDHLEDEPDKK